MSPALKNALVRELTCYFAICEYSCGGIILCSKCLSFGTYDFYSLYNSLKTVTCVGFVVIASTSPYLHLQH